MFVKLSKASLLIWTVSEKPYIWDKMMRCQQMEEVWLRRFDWELSSWVDESVVTRMTSNDILWCQQLKLNMRVTGQISDILSFIAAYHWEAVQERWILRNNLIKPATDAIITSWVETTELFQCFISSSLSVLLPRKLDLCWEWYYWNHQTYINQQVGSSPAQQHNVGERTAK